MRARVSVDREEMDRLVLMRMDVDRYEAQLIPDLQARVQDLTQALELLVAAAADASRSNLLEAVARAKQVLQT
jgi:hypothetical protein